MTRRNNAEKDDNELENYEIDQENKEKMLTQCGNVLGIRVRMRNSVKKKN